MALVAKEGEVVTDGKNVTIGAPCVRATGRGMEHPPEVEPNGALEPTGSEDAPAKPEQKE